MIFLLFSGEKQYGLLACDIQQEEFPFFYVISLQIGLSLHYLEISKAEAGADRKCPEIWSSYVSETGYLDLFPNMMN